MMKEKKIVHLHNEMNNRSTYEHSFYLLLRKKDEWVVCG